MSLEAYNLAFDTAQLLSIATSTVIEKDKSEEFETDSKKKEEEVGTSTEKDSGEVN